MQSGDASTRPPPHPWPSSIVIMFATFATFLLAPAYGEWSSQRDLMAHGHHRTTVVLEITGRSRTGQPLIVTARSSTPDPREYRVKVGDLADVHQGTELDLLISP